MEKPGFFTTFLISLILAASIANAQKCEVYFPMEVGSAREMTSYDANGKVTGRTVQTVKEVLGEKKRIDIIVQMEVYDEKDRLQSVRDLNLACIKGLFIFDMRGYVEDTKIEGTGEVELDVETTDLKIPSKLQPGQELEDAQLSVAASANGITMFRVTVDIHNRKVISEEQLTTPAGSFDCYKLAYSVDVNNIVKTESTAIEWLAEGIGVVRNETYNKNGKLTGYSILTAIH